MEGYNTHQQKIIQVTKFPIKWNIHSEVERMGG